ncbi:MAG TPA: serine/threonine-protein kinase, partial [Gemmataceae bacterium]|nr:serine/threonine-protein kinase [Gemmataceae bacterium]
MRPVSNLGQLNTNDWERLQTHADRFEDACKAGQAVDLRAFLPPETDPLRRNCLHELIKLDLELRWRRGEAVTLSYYLEKFTELGPARSLPTSLLFEEFLVRHRHGDRPSLESYKARFPEQFEELARLVRERDMPTSAGPVATPFSRKARPAAPVPSPPPTPTGFPIAPGAGVLQAGSVLSTGHSLVKRIGMGGFGEVWEALAPGGVRTAIKIILRPLDHEAAKHELEALELIKNLRHHFLLRTHAFKAELDRLVIVMDLADGSLRDRLKQIAPKGGQGLPLEELLLYARETGEALDYLHSKGVMHRDIKPENLLMSEGHIRVADFGLALLHKGARSIAGSGSGTPLYMPPEFWREKVSMHSDQYSFAASYVELRLGRRLFPDQGFMSLMKAHL